MTFAADRRSSVPGARLTEPAWGCGAARETFQFLLNSFASAAIPNRVDDLPPIAALMVMKTSRLPGRRLFHLLAMGPARRGFGSWLLILLAVLVGPRFPVGCAAETRVGDGGSAAATEGYVERVEAWRRENERKLAAPDGWLALVAHVWLEPGRQTIGVLPADDIRLPAELGALARAEVLVEDGRVYLVSDAAAGFRIDEGWQRRAELRLDSEKAEANGVERVTLGDRVRVQLVRRAGRLALRVRDARSDAIASFRGKRWFPVDARYRFHAVYHAYAEPKPLRIENVRGDETTMELVGYAEFEVDGKRHRLEAMLESPTELFFVFRDATTGRSTYGGGRFLNTEVPVDGESFELDFNQAYNPPCAVSPHTLCPLPPPQNHLPVAIQAGELP